MDGESGTFKVLPLGGFCRWTRWCFGDIFDVYIFGNVLVDGGLTILGFAIGIFFRVYDCELREYVLWSEVINNWLFEFFYCILLM